MPRRTRFDTSIAAIALFAAAATASACGSVGTDRSPQAIVLVTLDTTRADRLGCYGNRSIETPSLDGVARDGVLFEAASAPAPLTLPSHSSMMTGRYPASHGVRHNGM